MANQLTGKTFVRIQSKSKFDEVKSELDGSASVAFLEDAGSENGKDVLYAQGKYWNGSVTNKVTTNNEITIAGGPLADKAPAAWGGKIPAGKDVQSILMDLFCKELYPGDTGSGVGKPSISSAFITSTLPQVDVTLTLVNQTVEPGVKTTLSAVDGKAPTYEASSRKFNNFKYGYALGTGAPSADYHEGAPAEVPVTGVSAIAGTFKLTTTFNGFNNAAATGNATSSNAEAVKCHAIGTELTVSDGANSVTYKMEGPGHKGNVAGTPKYYAASNLHSTKDDLYVEAVGQQEVRDDAAATSTVTKSITGKRHAFWGSLSTKHDGAFNSAEIRALADLGNDIYHGKSYQSQSGNKLGSKSGVGQWVFVIALPKGWTLSKVTNDNAMDDNITKQFIKETVSVEGAQGYKAVDYDVYVLRSGSPVSTLYTMYITAA